MSKKDIDTLKTYSWWVWHNAARDWSIGGVFIDTNWKKPYKFPLSNLVYAEENWIVWNNIRTIEPNDIFTKKVVARTIRLFEAEKLWRLDEYLETNKKSKYIGKAYELYKYWRDDLE